MSVEKKKYKVIAKVDNKAFVRYHVNDLVKFTVFLDAQFPSWRWFNVYRFSKEGNGEQLQSFTNKFRPTIKFID